MKDEKNNFTNIERKVQRFFQKQGESLKAGKDLWPKLESRLGEKLKDVEPNNTKKRLGRWFAGSRLVAISVSVAVVLILITVGSLWLTTNHSANTITSSSTTIMHGLGGNVRGSINQGTVPQITLAPTTTVALPPPVVVTIPQAATTTLAASGFNDPNSGMVWGLEGSSSANSNPTILDTSGREVISQASISLEVQTVSTALNQIETMAGNLGGMIDSMSSTGEQDQQQATITIRVPQAQFLTAIDRLQTLGTVQSQNVTSQDVTSQFIDLQARLKSSQLEEQSLQAILDKAVTISDIISIQDQLNQVRSTIESLQGQINYIQNRVDLATITISLNEPTQSVGQPPSASLTVEVSNVDDSLAAVKQLVSGLGGIIDSNTISLNNGKESAYLSLRVYSANFDQVVMAIGKEGKIQQKTVQEDVTTQNGQSQQSNSPPDTSISLSLIEVTGFWTTTNITVVAIAGGVVIVTLVAFLVLAGRAGLLRKQKS